MPKHAVAEREEPRFSADGPNHFIRQWRKHRKMTQEQLAEAAGMSVSSISQLEKGKQGYSQPTLEALAAALKCRPGDLLMRDPAAEGGPMEAWEKLTPAGRRQAEKILKALLDEDAAA